MTTKNAKAEVDATENGNAWDANEYAKRKAQRAEKKPAQWVVNPETNEKFYLRRVGILGPAMSGALPHILTNNAVAAWKEVGLDVGQTEAGDQPDQLSPELVEEGNRSIGLVIRVVTEACVIPKIGKGEGEVDPSVLDDSDILFIMEWATGQRGSLPLKGGEAVPVASLERFSKKPRQRSRAGANG